MKRVGVFTIFNVPNYGAMLQSYALTNYLQGVGYDARVVDYQQPELRDYFKYRLSFPPQVRHWLRLHSCRKFVAGNLRLTEGFLPGKGFVGSGEGPFDAFITGSDQVWFTGPVQYYDRYFFLDFDTKGARRISYAASAGGTTNFGEFRGSVERAIKAFDYLGVRDAHTRSLIRPLTDANIEETVDPVYLHSFSEFIDSRPPMREPYVLVFGDLKGESLKILEAIKRKLGIKEIVTLQYANSMATRRVASPGPIEWLNWFYHSSFVVTSYFHGTVVATKFKKDFISIPTAGRVLKVRTLLEPLGLVERCLDKGSGGGALSILDRPIDWSDAHSKLNAKIERSKRFLATALS